MFVEKTKRDNRGKISNSVPEAEFRPCQEVTRVKHPLNNTGDTGVLQSCSFHQHHQLCALEGALGDRMGSQE